MLRNIFYQYVSLGFSMFFLVRDSKWYTEAEKEKEYMHEVAEKT